MNKGLIFIIGIISFLGFNTVKAEEIYFEYDTNINEIQTYMTNNNISYELFNNEINKHIKYYNDNYSQDYPYMYIHISLNGFGNFFVNTEIFNKIDYIYSMLHSNAYILPIGGDNKVSLSSKYDSTNSLFSDIVVDTGSYSNRVILSFNFDENLYYYIPYGYYYSNFDYYYKGTEIIDSTSNWTGLNSNHILNIPLFNDSSKYSVYAANTDFLIEPYYLYDENSSIEQEYNKYTTINLNDYSYVALSLKNYNTIPENNLSVYTNLSVKGQLCITPVYNYGQTERKDILTGTQIQGCSQYYNDFTLTRMYILKDDVENHAIYYLKAYDTSKENFVKVDTSKFYITYITEDKKDNPEVLINGKVYPTLSYGSLTDTSTKSEDEGYVPGVSCAVGDFNCYNKYNSENIFDEVFSSPLDFLKNIWSSVTSIFNLITEFISLLPPIMQSFLYLSFMVAVAFGLIKLIL